MDNCVVVIFVVFLYGARGDGDFECIPGATLPHPDDCTMYFICDANNDRSMFVCAWGHRFNPETSSCDHEENVTCSGAKSRVEQRTTTDEASSADVEDKEREQLREEMKQEEPDLHKEFYLVEDSSDESTTMGESKDSSQNEDSETFNSYQSPSKEENSLVFKYNVSKENEETPEPEEDKVEDLPDKSTEKTLDQQSFEAETEEFDKVDSELSAESDEKSEPKDNVEEGSDYEEIKTDDVSFTKDSDIPNSQAVGVEDNVGSDEGQIDRLKKRHSSADELETKADDTGFEEKSKNEESQVEEEENEGLVKDEDFSTKDTSKSLPNSELTAEVIKLGLEEKSEAIKSKLEGKKMETLVEDQYSSPKDFSQHLKNVENFQITNLNGTNIISFGLPKIPLFNWTETTDENDWTNLLVFWKHPTDLDNQGSMELKYPKGSPFSDLEMQDIVIGIMDTEGNKQVNIFEGKTSKDVSHETKDEGTQTT